MSPALPSPAPSQPAVGLEVEGLRVTFDGFVAVADTSFRVEPGGDLRHRR